MDLIGVDLFGLDLIKVKDGDEDDRGKTCVKAAVIQHESAVHCRRFMQANGLRLWGVFLQTETL